MRLLLGQFSVCSLCAWHPLHQAMVPIGKRTITIAFGGMEIKLEVRDPHLEWELRPSPANALR